MDAFFFWYTVALILVCFAAAMLAVGAYAVSHRKALLAQVSFFTGYIVEISGIFGEEWLSQNLVFSPERYYDIPQPAMRILLGTMILVSLWVMLLNVLDVHDRRLVAIPTAAFVLANVVVLVALPYGALRQWLFYSLRQLFSAAGLAFAWWKWHSSSDEAYRARLGRHRRSFALICLLLLATFVEDCLIILVLPVPSPESSWLMLYLSERNFSENALMLYVAYHSIRTSLEQLALRREVPPSVASAPVASVPPAPTPAGDGPATTNRHDAERRREEQRTADLARHIEDMLPRFARSHGLSDREAEVLSYVVQGKTNREIAAELFLSEGTIKTHVHNITKKCRAASRKELRQAFWAS